MLTEHTSIDVLVVNNATLEGIGPLTELPRQRDPSATPPYPTACLKAAEHAATVVRGFPGRGVAGGCTKTLRRRTRSAERDGRGCVRVARHVARRVMSARPPSPRGAVYGHMTLLFAVLAASPRGT